MIKDVRHFTNELNLITDPSLRDFARWFLMNIAPNYFWTIGASASGKYHPAFAKGEGGLVRHVKGAMRVLDELLDLNTYSHMSDLYKDYARVAILIHDCFKYGKGPIDKSQYANHGKTCAHMVEVAWYEMFQEQAPDLLIMAVESHMGQWHGPEERKPFSPIDRLVHLADYISSRSFFDIPEVSAEWEEIAMIDTPY